MPRALLLSELFPPALGGSAVLFENVYSRLEGVGVTVVTDAARSPGPERERRGRLTVLRRPIATRRFGVLERGALGHHLRVAAMVRRTARELARGNGHDGHGAGDRSGAGAGTVVHCGRALPEGVAARLARALGGPRYVCWAHGEDVATALTSRELAFLQKRVYSGAAAVVANSRSTAGLLEAIGVAPARIRVVHPGVDASRFRPDVDGTAVRRRLAPDGRGPVVLSVGRLQRRKGHDLAIAAVAALREELPDLRYVLVGDGEERARLESLAANAGVADRVVFAGEVADEDLPAYYAACDIFALPNRVDGADIEGFGIVFLEAQAAGKAVVGGRSGGVPEAVADLATGLLVSGREVEELAAAIRRLARDASLRAALGRAGRERVLRAFTWEAAASAVAAVHAGVAVPADRRSNAAAAKASMGSSGSERSEP